MTKEHLRKCKNYEGFFHEKTIEVYFLQTTYKYKTQVYLKREISNKKHGQNQL